MKLKNFVIGQYCVGDLNHVPMGKQGENCKYCGHYIMPRIFINTFRRKTMKIDKIYFLDNKLVIELTNDSIMVLQDVNNRVTKWNLEINPSYPTGLNISILVSDNLQLYSKGTKEYDETMMAIKV